MSVMAMQCLMLVSILEAAGLMKIFRGRCFMGILTAVDACRDKLHVAPVLHGYPVCSAHC
jgi:hypothetical protein